MDFISSLLKTGISMGKSLSYWKYFEQSLSTTSVRGLSKTVKSQNYCCGVLWALVITALIICAVVGAVTVIKTYCSYPIMTVHDEFVYYHTEEGTKEFIRNHFPSVTVCNAKALSGNSSKGATSFEEYLQILEDYSNSNPGAVIPKELQSQHGYFSYLGVNRSEMMGHSYEELVITCEVLLRIYSVSKPCKDYVYVRRLVSVDHFNCYLIEYNTSALQYENLPRGFAFTIYIGSVEDSVPSQSTMKYLDKELDTGVLMALQTPGKYPNLWNAAHHLAPGFHHRINFDTVSRVRLPSPYISPDCMDTDPEVMMELQGPGFDEAYLWDLSGHKVGYSHDAQIMACVNRAILNQCSCVDPEIPVLDVSDLANVTLCGDVNVGGIPQAVERLECMDKVKKEDVPNCASESQLECKQSILSSHISSYAWPRPLHQLAFYESHIRGKPFQPHFNIYEDIKELLGNGEKEKASEMLKSTSLIADNFLKVSVVSLGSCSTRIKDTPMWTLTTFLSQLGGTLNLWAGISLVCIFEGLELLKDMIYCYIQRKRGVLLIED